MLKGHYEHPRREEEITRSKRLKAYKFGKFAEWVTLLFLLCKGYKVLACSWKHPLGEIDIIAKRKETLVFIEVKARRGKEIEEEVLSYQQQQRIINAAACFMARQPVFSSYFMRFDLVIIRPYRWPLHIKQAWE